MHMELQTLLSELLTEDGYEVEDAPPLEGRSGASYPVSLVAERDGDRFLVDVLPSRPVGDRDLEALGSIVDDTGVDGAILFALRGVDDGTEPGPGLNLWSRDQLEHALGARVLDRALDGDHADATPEILPEPGTAPDTPAEPAEEIPAGSDGSAEPADDGDAELLTDEDPTPQPAEATAADGEEGFLSAEEMAQRAQQMLEQGDLPEDGDAELLEDDGDGPAEPEPSDAPHSPEDPTPAMAGDAEPEPEATPEQAPAAQEGQVFEDADCELLPSKPRTDPEPASDPEPEAADPPVPEQPAAPQREAQSPSVPTEPVDQASDEPSTPEPSSGSPLAAAGVDSEPGEEGFLSGACIEPTIDRREARSTAEGALFNVDEIHLELLPFQVFAYECVLEGGDTRRQEEGRVWVSAQSGAIIRAPDGPKIEEPEEPFTRFQGDLHPEQVREQVLEHLVEALEVRDEVRQDYSESAIIERVTLEPDPESIRIEHLGSAYAPRWRVEGQNGTVFVDAVTGDLVSA